MSPHGTMTRYTQKCRCAKCLRANRDYHRERRRQLVARGCCPNCGLPSAIASMCGGCLTVARIKRQQRKAARSPAAGEVTGARRLTCSMRISERPVRAYRRKIESPLRDGVLDAEPVCIRTAPTNESQSGD